MFNNRRQTRHTRQTEIAITGLIITSMAAGSLTTSGCASRGGILGVDCCADIPAGAVPEPAGVKVCQWQTAQVGSAIVDQTVMYQADFIGRSETLSPGAVDRMARNANSGLAAIQPTIVEPSGDAQLDAARIAAVSARLASFGIAAPIVQLATPAALGLRGIEAEQVAGGVGNRGNAARGAGAPIAQPSALGGQGFGNSLGGGFGGQGGNFPGGVF